MPSVIHPSSSDLPAFASVRRHMGENPCATVFRPFFTVFDRFPRWVRIENSLKNQVLARLSPAAQPLENGENGENGGT
jgi:hypothetical protein